MSDDAFTSKQKSLAIIPKFSGMLSFIGSVYIFQDVLRSRQLRAKPYNRLILGLSSFDIMSSVVNIMSTWPIPTDTDAVFLASGTTATCTAQGFFNETGNIATPLYNAGLCTYFILTICNGWKTPQIQKIEPFLHMVPVVFGLAMGIIGLPFDLYNSSGWLCWIAPYPSNCLAEEGVACERGELSSLFRWIHYGIVWSAIGFVTVGMFLIYANVSKRENKTNRYTNPDMYVIREGSSQAGFESSNAFRLNIRRRDSDDNDVPPVAEEETFPGSTSLSAEFRLSVTTLQGSGNSRGRGRWSRQVATQAMLFVGALYLTWIFTTLTRVFQILHGKTYYPLLVLMAIFFPLQGFFNALVYLRPRYVQVKSSRPEDGVFKHWWIVFAGSEEKSSDNLPPPRVSSTSRTEKGSEVATDLQQVPKQQLQQKGETATESES